MDTKDKLLVIGATLLPGAVTNDLGYKLDGEIHKDEWRRHAPDLHHIADEGPSASGNVANDSAAAGADRVPVLAVGERIEIPGALFVTEKGEFIVTEKGDHIVTESRNVIVTEI